MLIMPSKRRERYQSDFGRTYGWIMERGASEIGRLRYLDRGVDFWQDYAIDGLSEKYDFSDESTRMAFYEFWHDIALVNVRYPDYREKNYIPAPGNGLEVAMRGLHVPDKFYKGRTDR